MHSIEIIDYVLVEYLERSVLTLNYFLSSFFLVSEIIKVWGVNCIYCFEPTYYYVDTRDCSVVRYLESLVLTLIYICSCFF